MNRPFIFLLSLIIISGLTAAGWADCRSDINCSGFVDGSDLAILATDYGTHSCPSTVPQVIGTIFFEDLPDAVPLPLYQVHLGAYRTDTQSPAILEDLAVVMGQSYLTARLAQLGADGGLLGDIRIAVDGEVVLALTDQTHLTGLDHLLPERTIDPYRVAARLTGDRLEFDWSTSHVLWRRGLPTAGCTLTELKLVHDVGFQGDPGAIVPPYEPIANFSWMFDIGVSGPQPDMRLISVTGPMNPSGPCLLHMLFGTLVLNRLGIQKWGPQIDERPVTDILMTSAIPLSYSFSANSQGAPVQNVNFQGASITWTEGGFDGDGHWVTYTGSFSWGSP